MLATVIAAALVFVSAPDGHTMVVRDGNVKTVLRRAEVDAPERTQPYSQLSRRNVVALCKEAKAIKVQPVSLDRYGRTVAHVHCDGVRQLATSTRRSGMVLSQVPDAAERVPFEIEAMNARRGLWRDDLPIAPWEFRANKNGAESTR